MVLKCCYSLTTLDALLNVASIYSLIDHCDGVVGIADHALTLGIECQFLAAEDVLAGARTVCPEITGRADISPLDIPARTKLAQSLCHCCGEGLEDVWEVRAVSHANSVFRIYIQTASAASYNQSSIRAGEDVAQVLQRGAVLGKCFLRPRSERVNHHVKALQVSSSQVEQILFQNLLGHGGIVSTNNGGHIQTSVYTASFTMSLPAFPFAPITASFILNSS
ncbi:MAG: hypothetical protein ACLSHU_07980 [Oscillospiraceae bacterium]